MLPKGMDGIDAILEASHNQMLAATQKFGVNPDTYSFIEEIYAEQLAAFDAHFSACPYLFGGRHCRGDFGLTIWLHPHLGRDPKARALLQKQAKAVFRFTERMNRLASDLVEFENQDEIYFPDDHIPDTLVTVMRAAAEDFVPETLAATDTINAWIAQQNSLEPGTHCKRSVGTAQFELRGQTVSANAQPYRFFLLKRAQDEYAAMGDADREAMDAILEASNMKPVLDARLTREVGMQGNMEVWL